MPWEITEDVEVYAERVWPLLAAHPAQNTVALTVIEGVRAGYRWSDEGMVFGWYDDGQVSGAVILTPPFELLLTVVPDASVDELVTELRVREVAVPGVHGEVGLVERFATTWIRGTSCQATTAMKMRLYRLGTLHPPTPPPPGHARRALADDVDLAVRWFRAFHDDTGGHSVSDESVVRHKIDNGLLWVWEDHTGAVVSLAGRQLTAAGVARVGPVYTPAQHRRRGYGTAVTAACTNDALDCGAQQVVLHTDLSNSTSNTIYQRIGYRPISDRATVRFQH